MRAFVFACAALAATVAVAPLPRSASVPAPAHPAPTGGGAQPEPPRIRVETDEPRLTGRTIRVPAGGSLQKAIDEAKGGDLIALVPGAVYRGPFHLTRKDGDGWIVITSEAPPPPGRRVHPRMASRMPKLVALSDSVVVADPGAHHYRLVGLEIAPGAGAFLRHELVQIGQEETRADDLPHHIVVDRCYLRGDPHVGARRGVGLNGSHSAVIDSYLADFKEVGNDSQAIAGWNGGGPFRIANNYLEAAGENVMFGGADPTIQELVPADIEITHNHLAKPFRWKVGDPSYQGTEWAVKNLFELKNARRVLVDGNVLEHNWAHAQNGFAILFTVRNQEGGAPWSTIEDVTFANNLVRHVAAGVNILGHDDNHRSQQVRRIAIRNNLFADVGGPLGNGRLFQLLDGTADVTIDHNTAFHTGSLLFGGDHAPHTGFVFQNNIAFENQHGISGSGTEPGGPTLARYFPGALVRRNVIVGASAARYPADNFFPGSLNDIGAVDRRDGLYRIALNSRFARNATDGRDPGADLDAITTAFHKATANGSEHRALAAHDAFSLVLSLSKDELTSLTQGLRSSFDKSGNGTAGIFWLAVALLAYTFVGYPVIARLRALVRPKRRIRAPIEPAVTVIVVAYNEEARIAARIENLLALDYPRDRIDIVVASDGSTDGTVVEAHRFARSGVTVRAFFARRGKPAVLNELIGEARGEIVVLADARQQFDPAAIRELVANFADPSIGAVSGALVLETTGVADAGGTGAAFYWRYERFLRSTESRGGSLVGATGAIYAIRRSLFEPIPDDTILDDVLIPMRMVRRGYGIAFEPAARAYDTASKTGRQELVRKVRTIGGTFQLFAKERWLLDPRRNPLWFETVSHKALRLATPGLLVAIFVANLTLAADPLYRWLFAGQILFYALAAAGAAIPYAIVLMSAATVLGCFRFASGRLQVTWERPAPQPTTARHSSSPGRLRSPTGIRS